MNIIFRQIILSQHQLHYILNVHIFVRAMTLFIFVWFQYAPLTMLLIADLQV